MVLLVSYVLIALVFSFLCSIAEAVLLSVTDAHIRVLQQENSPSGDSLYTLKSDINKPLAAILSLNTIAHTVGAVGAGAQAAIVFGDGFVGMASAILTLLILVFSEIIPKTIGASYWRSLAPAVAVGVKFTTWFLHPLVWCLQKITSGLNQSGSSENFSRKEFSAMAEIGARQGTIDIEESKMMHNLLLFGEMKVEQAMTPRTVVFYLSAHLTVEEFFHKYDKTPFTRILVYQDDEENIVGFVIRTDLLLAQARGNSNSELKTYCRPLRALLHSSSLSHALKEMLRLRAQIVLLVD